MSGTVSIPTYLVGRNVSLMAVAPATVSAEGDITAGTSVSLKDLGVFDGFEFEGEWETEEIHSADADCENNVPKYTRWSVNVTEIDNADGTSTLMGVFTANAYVRVAVAATAPGDSSSGNLFAAIGLMKNVRKTFVEGKNATQITVIPCGIPFFWGDSSDAPF